MHLHSFGPLVVLAGACAASLPTTAAASFPVQAPPAPSRIINGDDAAADHLPMAGAILVRQEVNPAQGGPVVSTSLVCSSVLIAPDVVLTAAHCVEQPGWVDPQLFWSPKADLFDYATADETGEILPAPPAGAIAATGAVMHADFRFDEASVPLGQVSDIALLFLSEPAEGTPLAYVPTTEDGDGVETAEDVTVVGWGMAFAEIPEDFTRYVGVKRSGVSPVGVTGDWEFQVGQSPEQPRQCSGDSGGPVFSGAQTERDAVVQVVGVASRTWDENLCERDGAINTRVLPYRDWIETQMMAACENGLRTQCERPGLPSPDAAAGLDEDTDEGGGCSVRGAPQGSCGWCLALLGLVWARRSRRSRLSAPRPRD